MNEILTVLIAIETILLIKIFNKYQLYYSNYQNCLSALAEYDEDLAKYLKNK